MGFFDFFGKKRRNIVPADKQEGSTEISVKPQSNSAPSQRTSQEVVMPKEALLSIEEQLKGAVSEHDAFVEEMVRRHSRVLSKKIRQHQRLDEYGKETGFNEIGEEVDYFLSHVIKTEPGYREIRKRLVNLKMEFDFQGRNKDDYHLDRYLEGIEKQIDDNLIPLIFVIAKSDKPQSGSTEKVNVDVLSGMEFEIYCEDQLRNLGWSVSRKGGTGDQGVDLIARKHEKVVAIQCKRYSSPVGNQAVQQVEAGRQFDEADLAVVVSNSGFTPAAQQLAAKLKVILIHHSDLVLLEEYL